MPGRIKVESPSDEVMGGGKNLQMKGTIPGPTFRWGNAVLKEKHGENWVNGEEGRGEACSTPPERAMARFTADTGESGPSEPRPL